MCKVDLDRAAWEASYKEKEGYMVEALLGVDIAKKKFDGALLINGKLKHKVFPNSQEGFEALLAWLKKQGTDHVRVCGGIKYIRR